MMRDRRAFSLIEVLMVVVISTVAMFGLAVPLVADRSFNNRGKRKTEAQRDAEMAMRAIAFTGRETRRYDVSPFGSNSAELRFGLVSGAFFCFDGGPSFGKRLIRHNCGDPPTGTVQLIDGNRSQVEEFTATPILNNKLVRVHLRVTHRLRPGDPITEDEILETELFLRNGT